MLHFFLYHVHFFFLRDLTQRRSKAPQKETPRNISSLEMKGAEILLFCIEGFSI